MKVGLIKSLMLSRYNNLIHIFKYRDTNFSEVKHFTITKCAVAIDKSLKTGIALGFKGTTHKSDSVKFEKWFE